MKSVSIAVVTTDRQTRRQVARALRSGGMNVAFLDSIDDVRSAMVIGHNPTMQVLALRLAAPDAGVADGSDLAEIQRKFPTGALATLTFEGGWSTLAPGAARLTAHHHARSRSPGPTAGGRPHRGHRALRRLGAHAGR